MAITNKQLAELLATVTVGADHEATLNVAYQTAFGRNVDDEGLAYWSDRLENGLDAETELLEALLDGAVAYEENAEYPENVAVNATDKTVIVNKSEVAEAILANTAVTNEQAETILATVTTDASKASALDDVAAIVPAPVIDGETFVLTTSTDSFVGTAANDLFTAANGTLQTADTILDSSSTDSDIMNATVTSATAAPRLQNIETVNVDGLYTTAGLDLANVSGTKVLNLNTSIANGVATVLNASSLNAETINAKANIGTLNVTATASGTRDTVTVDAGSANLNLNGNLGTDYFNATVVDGTSVTIGDVAGGTDVDMVTLNAAGEIDLDGTIDAKTFTLNATDDLTVTLANGQTLVGSAAASKWDITGTGDVTLVVADDASASDLTDFDDKALTNSGTGKVTLKIEDESVTAGADLDRVQVDVVELAKDGTGTIDLTVNEGSVVNLTGDATKTDLNLDVNHADPDTAAYTAHEGTLLLNVSDDQTTGAITTGAGVGVVLIEATPDEESDTECGAEISIANLDTVANQAGAGTADQTGTNTVVVQGSADLTITQWTAGNSNDKGSVDTLTASTMTGDLTISDIHTDLVTEGALVATAGYVTVVLGQGNDSLAVSADTKDALSVFGTAGTNTINLSGSLESNKVVGGTGVDKITASGNGDNIKGGAGDDIITLGTGDDTIDGGTGNDTVILNTAANTVTLGAGADTVVADSAASIMDGTDDTEIKDFNAAEDKLILTGAGNGDIDLGEVTVAAGAVYTFSDATHEFKLTGNSATDMSAAVQLGKIDAAFEATDASTVKAGSNNDVIAVATGETATITTGAGNDVVVLGGAGADFADLATNDVSVVTDFTVGTDVVVLTGTNAEDISLKAIQVDGENGNFTLGVDSTGATGDFAFSLTDVSAEKLTSIVQLGHSGDTTQSGYDAFTDATFFVAADDTTVIGGDFSDYIEVKNAESATVEGGKGKDYINILDTSATADKTTVVIGKDESTTSAWDEIKGFDVAVSANNDTLDLAAEDVNIAELISTTQVGDITGVTVKDGVITTWNGIANTINSETFADAVAYLEANVAGTDTVAFYYADTACDGTLINEAVFVYQAGVTDTLVELVGLTSTDVTAISATAAADTITIA